MQTSMCNLMATRRIKRLMLFRKLGTENRKYYEDWSQYRAPFGESNRHKNMRELTYEIIAKEDELEETLPPPGSAALKDFVAESDTSKSGVIFFRRAWKNYFKDAKHREDNLLSWAAIDQVRNLHKSDPTFWTASKIAESFPISETEALRLIRSKPRPASNTERIRKHDSLVRKRWEALAKGDPNGVVSELTKKLLADGKIKFLPMFPLSSKKNVVDLPDTQSDEAVGMFQRMAQRHLRTKEMKH